MKKIILLLIGFIFCQNVFASDIDYDYANGIYHFVLSGDNIKKQMQFVSSSNLITNKEAHNNSQSRFTINTGYFDPKNQKTVSYIVNGYQTIEDPIFNESLMLNPSTRKRLKQILNRTEFRILDCDSKLKYEIASHDSKVDFMCSIKESAQGGPQLLPNLRLEEESFIIKDSEGNVVKEYASVLQKTPRTLIGLKSLPKGEQEVHVFIVTNKNPMDLYEAKELCASYGLDSAMAFDGGSSTSLNYKKINVISTQDNGDTGRALKSFMIIKK